MIIDYDDDGIIRWERDGEKKQADIVDLINAFEKQNTGRWTEKYIDDGSLFFKRRFYCSACGDWTTIGKSAYCPNCGADMRGGE